MRYYFIFLLGIICGMVLLFALAAFAVEKKADDQEEKWWRK